MYFLGCLLVGMLKTIDAGSYLIFKRILDMIDWPEDFPLLFPVMAVIWHILCVAQYRKSTLK